MTLLKARTQQLDSASYGLFGQAQRRPQWSARELIGSGRTALSESQLEGAWHAASMGYYTEQAGLVAAAELAVQTEDFMLRLSLATAVADEARHADAFLTYAVARGGDIADYANDAYIDDLHASLSSAGYLQKCVLHTMLEGFAADEFIVLQRVFAGDPLATILRHIRADELRHVAIGLDYLRRAGANPGQREELRAHGGDWECHGLAIMNFPASVHALGSLLGQEPGQLERWFMRRHRARLRGAGIPHGGEGVNR